MNNFHTQFNVAKECRYKSGNKRQFINMLFIWRLLNKMVFRCMLRFWIEKLTHFLMTFEQSTKSFCTLLTFQYENNKHFTRSSSIIVLFYCCCGGGYFSILCLSFAHTQIHKCIIIKTKWPCTQRNIFAQFSKCHNIFDSLIVAYVSTLNELGIFSLAVAAIYFSVLLMYSTHQFELV